ncbi:hypothetical protein E4U55_008123 [Claviceps digitariae]|nr:hypothetical protein E4U55_008123 [Claviceps digitariae]
MTVFFATMVLVNCLPVRIYGEAEFVFGAIKLTTIVGLILLMFLIAVGGSPTGQTIGFRYCTYLKEGHLGRFLAFYKVFIQATLHIGAGKWSL